MVNPEYCTSLRVYNVSSKSFSSNKIFESSRNLPWAIKILNAIDYITNESLSEIELTNIVKRRNDFIHANTTTGEKVNINMEDLLFINKIISIGLKNII